MADNSSAITILMPVRNSARHIVAAIASLLAQTEADFRLLVIDDGSTDDSIERAAAIADKRIFTFSDGRQRGLAHRLNWGIEQAESAFVARMDADDIAEPDRLARQLTFMRSHPDVAICGTWYRTFDDRAVSEPIQLPTEHDSLRAMTLFASPFAHPTVIFNRALINQAQLRYCPEALHAEDYDLWERAANVVRLANIPQALLRYRLHSQQVSARNGLHQQESADRVRRRALQRLGVSFSEEELQLHCDCAHGKLLPVRERCEATKVWLRKLAFRFHSQDPALVEECLRREMQLHHFLVDRSRRQIWWRRWLRRVRTYPGAGEWALRKGATVFNASRSVLGPPLN